MANGNYWLVPGSGLFGALSPNAVPHGNFDPFYSSNAAPASLGSWPPQPQKGAEQPGYFALKAAPQSFPYLPGGSSWAGPSSGVNAFGRGVASPGQTQIAGLGSSLPLLHDSPLPSAQAYGQTNGADAGTDVDANGPLPDRSPIPLQLVGGSAIPWAGPLPPFIIPGPDPDHVRNAERGLTEFFRRRFGGSGSGRGGNDRDDGDECYNRWKAEDDRCWQLFRPFGARALDGCKKRAAARRSLCISNGGRPDPNEPDEWTWNDIPRDALPGDDF